MKWLADKLIAKAEDRRYSSNSIVTYENKHLFTRFNLLFPDEHWRNNELRDKLPWWLPFNIFLHRWENTEPEANIHDHPRYSLTIVLRGCLRETDLVKDRYLTPGNIVFRGINNPHIFNLPLKQEGPTWTLFIVGRRKYAQYIYDTLGNKIGRL